MSVLALTLLACAEPEPAMEPYSGAVVALQDASALALLDLDGALRDTLALVSSQNGREVPWMIHNVQITPDGLQALATAMTPMDDAGTYLDVHDELVIVDLASHAVRRCVLDAGLGAAHVVTDGSFAWVSAYDQDRIVEVDLTSCETTNRWPLPPGTGPHGLRRSVDGAALFVAGMTGSSLHRVWIDSGDVTTWSLPGNAVQVAVVPDGSAILATLNDTRQVARLDPDTEVVAVFDLPDGAQGPAQIYPSPDSARVWIADQGAPGAPIYGHALYAMDATTGVVDREVNVDPGPHGVVVSPDGATIWVSALGMGTAVRVDAATGTVLSSTAIGEGPNGISLVEGGNVPQ